MQREPVAPEPAGPWLDTAAAARHLGREPGTLRGWRSIGKGPAFHLVSGQVRPLSPRRSGRLREGRASGGKPCQAPSCRRREVMMPIDPDR